MRRLPGREGLWPVCPAPAAVPVASGPLAEAIRHPGQGCCPPTWWRQVQACRGPHLPSLRPDHAAGRGGRGPPPGPGLLQLVTRLCLWLGHAYSAVPVTPSLSSALSLKQGRGPSGLEGRFGQAGGGRANNVHPGHPAWRSPPPGPLLCCGMAEGSQSPAGCASAARGAVCRVPLSRRASPCGRGPLGLCRPAPCLWGTEVPSPSRACSSRLNKQRPHPHPPGPGTRCGPGSK